MNFDLSGLFGMWGRRDRTPRPHEYKPERSAAWNAWREKQKLHPQGRSLEFRPAPPKAPRRPDYDARVSTRASRRRRHRAESQRLAGRS